MLRSLLNGAMRSRSGAGYGSRGGHSGGYGSSGGGYGRRGGGRNALMGAGLGMLANRFMRGRR